MKNALLVNKIVAKISLCIKMKANSLYGKEMMHVIMGYNFKGYCPITFFQ